MTDLEKVIRGEAEESELTYGHDDEALIGKGERRNRNKAVMLSVRIPADNMALLTQIAERLDVPVSALVRGFIQTGLAEQRGTSAPDVVDRLAADVQRLRQIVG